MAPIVHNSYSCQRRSCCSCYILAQNINFERRKKLCASDVLPSVTACGDRVRYALPSICFGKQRRSTSSGKNILRLPDSEFLAQGILRRRVHHNLVRELRERVPAMGDLRENGTEMNGTTMLVLIVCHPPRRVPVLAFRTPHSGRHYRPTFSLAYSSDENQVPLLTKFI